MTQTCGAGRERHHTVPDILRLKVVKLAEVGRVVLLERFVDAVHGVVDGTQVATHAETRFGNQHAHIQVPVGPRTCGGGSESVPAVRRLSSTAAAHALVLPSGTAATAAGTTFTADRYGGARDQEEDDGRPPTPTPPHIRTRRLSGQARG